MARRGPKRIKRDGFLNAERKSPPDSKSTLFLANKFRSASLRSRETARVSAVSSAMVCGRRARHVRIASGRPTSGCDFGIASSLPQMLLIMPLTAHRRLTVDTFAGRFAAEAAETELDFALLVSKLTAHHWVNIPNSRDPSSRDWVNTPRWENRSARGLITPRA